MLLRLRPMATNHPLRIYRQRAAQYWKRAKATRDPVLRQALFAIAGLFHEKASRREDKLATRGQGPQPRVAGAQADFGMMSDNHPLSRYRSRTAEYRRRALATRDPILQGMFLALAGLYQEMVSRREDHLARLRTAAEPAEAARERRRRAILARTSRLHRQVPKSGA